VSAGGSCLTEHSLSYPFWFRL